jgi:hypothetical protein
MDRSSLFAGVEFPIMVENDRFELFAWLHGVLSFQGKLPRFFMEINQAKRMIGIISKSERILFFFTSRSSGVPFGGLGERIITNRSLAFPTWRQIRGSWSSR